MAKKKTSHVRSSTSSARTKESGVPGMSRYTTQKNKRNTPTRLELKKFNPYLKRYTSSRSEVVAPPRTWPTFSGKPTSAFLQYLQEQTMARYRGPRSKNAGPWAWCYPD